jgi:hypothetical protein
LFIGKLTQVFSPFIYAMRPLDLLPAQLVTQARQLALLTRTVQAHLGAPLAEHCWVAGIDEAELRLVTDGPAWRHRLRYQQAEILKTVATASPLRPRRMRVTVCPPQAPAVRSGSGRAPLSARAAQAIEAGAQSLADPELSALLARLARHRR